MIQKIEVRTTQRNQFLNISKKVNEAVNKSGIKEGLCVVFIPHTTAGVTINENADPDVVDDIVNFLSKKIPVGGDFKHYEGNSDSHIKTLLTGSSVAVPISQGKLVLGIWQGIYFCEYDGPRDREAIIKII